MNQNNAISHAGIASYQENHKLLQSTYSEANTTQAHEISQGLSSGPGASHEGVDYGQPQSSISKGNFKVASRHHADSLSLQKNAGDFPAKNLQFDIKNQTNSQSHQKSFHKRHDAEQRRNHLFSQQQQRADSNGPVTSFNGAPTGPLSQGAANSAGGGLHSSGGSFGAHSYKTAIHNVVSGGPLGAKLARSRTTGKITAAGSLQNKQNILQMINCPCPIFMGTSQNQADCGKKQPLLFNSENSANCGHCGQFYAIKDQAMTHKTASGKKQVSSHTKIVKTVREAKGTFKLEQPISEIFKRMREVSQTILSTLDLHPYYQSKRVKRIDNLSYIADALQSENPTMHHAVYLMDMYSSKVPKSKPKYDTLLVSLACLLISTKYLQMKYPGADALNYHVNNCYTYDLIIATEEQVLDTIDWQLMVYPVYDFVRLFISQGCLFENENILTMQTTPDQVTQQRQIQDQVGYFKQYAEFFADFVLYQQCFIGAEPYLISCAIVAYARKYTGLGIIWPVELQLLTRQPFGSFSELYFTLDNLYKENFPDHHSTVNYANQLLIEPAKPSNDVAQKLQKRSGGVNKLQLSSGEKSKKSQGSSGNPGGGTTSVSNNVYQNLFGELKTPDKYAFDYNSVVSENKHGASTTNQKHGFVNTEIVSGSLKATGTFSSHDKLNQQITSSNSVEKFAAKRLNPAMTGGQGQKMIEISGISQHLLQSQGPQGKSTSQQKTHLFENTNNQIKTSGQPIVFSDNKQKQMASLAQADASLQKIINSTQVAHSDEKYIKTNAFIYTTKLAESTNTGYSVNPTGVVQSSNNEINSSTFKQQKAFPATYVAKTTSNTTEKVKPEVFMHQNYSTVNSQATLSSNIQQKALKDQEILEKSRNFTATKNNLENSKVGGHVTSPSANIAEADENEQEVPPFKPMIIKSSSQAVGGVAQYECKTSQKKSPQVLDAAKLNYLKESINSVNIAPKQPQSTTNQSAQKINLNPAACFDTKASQIQGRASIKGTTACAQPKEVMSSNKKSVASSSNKKQLGVTGFGHGPIKISQKIQFVNSSFQQTTKTKEQTTGKKQKGTETNSSQKMKMARSEVISLIKPQSLTFAKTPVQAQAPSSIKQDKQVKAFQVIPEQNINRSNVDTNQRQSIPNEEKREVYKIREPSVSSNQQQKTNPFQTSNTYVSGKPKQSVAQTFYNKGYGQMQISQFGLTNLDFHNEIDNQDQNKTAQTNPSHDNAGHGGRSVLSMKNAAEVIKRKGSFHQQQIDLKFNITRTSQQNSSVQQQVAQLTASQASSNVHEDLPLMKNAKAKNVPNGLLRRATGGAQGRQKSIGQLSYNKSTMHAVETRSKAAEMSSNRNYMNVPYAGGDYAQQNNDAMSIDDEEQNSMLQDGGMGLPRNASIEDLQYNPDHGKQQTDIMPLQQLGASRTQQSLIKRPTMVTSASNFNNPRLKNSREVHQPAVINPPKIFQSSNNKASVTARQTTFTGKHKSLQTGVSFQSNQVSISNRGYKDFSNEEQVHQRPATQQQLDPTKEVLMKMTKERGLQQTTQTRFYEKDGSQMKLVSRPSSGVPGSQRMQIQKEGTEQKRYAQPLTGRAANQKGNPFQDQQYYDTIAILQKTSNEQDEQIAYRKAFNNKGKKEEFLTVSHPNKEFQASIIPDEGEVAEMRQEVMQGVGVEAFGPDRPIQKMIKSGSQVLGKQRTRPNISRKDMLKQIDERKDKMSGIFEAAQATRPTSNERSSTKKGGGQNDMPQFVSTFAMQNEDNVFYLF